MGVHSILETPSKTLAWVATVLAAAVFPWLLRSPAAFAAVILVDTLNDENGLCEPAPGACSLREAIAAADPGDDIQFSVSGTITLTVGQLLIDKDLTITGPGENLLTLAAGSNRRVLRVTAGVTVAVSGLTVRGGRLPSNDPHGGGIHNQGDLTLTAVTVTDNRSFSAPVDLSVDGGDGGGIYNASGASLTLDQVAVSANVAGNGGPNFIGTGFRGGRGGGIANLGTLTIFDSTLAANTSGNGGDSNGRGGDGGGIYNTGTLTLEASTISANRTGDGGQFSSLAGEDGRGGGIYNAGTADLINATLSGNLTGIGADGNPSGGGGIYTTTGGVLRLRNVTVSDNTAGSDGGGLFVAGGSASLRHALVAGNRVGASLDDCRASGGTLTSDGYNLIGVVTGCSGLTNHDQTGSDGAPLDPLLGPLGNSGGPTATHPLFAGSPAVDAGDPAGCTFFDPGSGAEAPLGTDQRGQARPIDGDSDGVAVCDTGAFELLPPTFRLTVTLSGSGGGTVTSLPPGIDCGATCAADFVEGISVELTAAAAPGSAFSGWGGDCGGVGSCTVLLDQDRTVDAAFDLGPDIFTDGFESGDTSAWFSTVP